MGVLDASRAAGESGNANSALHLRNVAVVRRLEQDKGTVACGGRGFSAVIQHGRLLVTCTDVNRGTITPTHMSPRLFRAVGVRGVSGFFDLETKGKRCCRRRATVCQRAAKINRG